MKKTPNAPRQRPRTRRQQRGWVMISLSLGMIVLGIVIAIMYDQWRHESLKNRGADNGQYLKTITQATATYIEHYSATLGNTNIPSTVASRVMSGGRLPYDRAVPRIIAPSDPNQDSDIYRSNWLSSGALPANTLPYTAWNDTATKAICPSDQMCAEITVADLRAANFLDAGYPDTAPDGTKYTIRIRRNAAVLPAGNCNSARIDALLVADRPALGPSDEGQDTNGIPIGDPDVLAGIAQTVGRSDSYPLMVSRPTEAADLTAISKIIPAIAAVAQPAAGEMAFYGNADQIHNVLGPFVRPSMYGFDSRKIAEGTPVVRVSDWHGNKDGIYFRLDGACPMGGNLDMGGNMIKNMKQVILGAACDGVDVTSAASKALAGSLATLQAGNANGTNISGQGPDYLGAGYQVVCGFDSAAVNDPNNPPPTRGGYIWKKGTSGVVSLEDAQAGMMDGMETDSDWVCWGNGGPAFVANLKWVVWGGKVFAFANQMNGTWRNVTNSAAGYTLGVDYSHNSPFWAMTNGKGYNWAILYDSAHGFYCDQGKYPIAGGTTTYGDPNLDVLGDWAFGPNGIKFMVNGLMNIYPAQSNSGTMGGIPVSVTGNIAVSGANCIYNVDSTTGVSTLQGCSANSGAATATLSGNTVSSANDARNRIMVQTPLKQSSVWSFQKMTTMNMNVCKASGAVC
jgi:hypothetical protein